MKLILIKTLITFLTPLIVLFFIFSPLQASESDYESGYASGFDDGYDYSYYYGYEDGWWGSSIYSSNRCPFSASNDYYDGYCDGYSYVYDYGYVVGYEYGEYDYYSTKYTSYDAGYYAGLDDIVYDPSSSGFYYYGGYNYGGSGGSSGSGSSSDLNDDSCSLAYNYSYSAGDSIPAGIINESGDEDWLEITVDRSGTLTINLDVPSDKDYELEVYDYYYDYCSSLVGYGYGGTGSDETITLNMERSYKYALRIYGAWSTSYGSSYQLTTSFEESAIYPVVFLHGTTGNTADWYDMMTEVQLYSSDAEMDYSDSCNTVDEPSAGYPCITPGSHPSSGSFDPKSLWNAEYYWDSSNSESYGSISVYAERLEGMIDDILAATGSSKVVIVAHSMGGLVARRYMADDEENWHKVYKLLTVGTPNDGVTLANHISYVSPFLIVLGYGDYIDEWEDMGSDSSWVEDLLSDWNITESIAEAVYGSNDSATKKWGVVGGKYSGDDHATSDPNQWDLGQPIVRFTEIWSAIPDEWQDAINNFGSPNRDTSGYAYRLAYQADHSQLREPSCGGTLKAILEWAIDWSEIAEGSISVPGCTTEDEEASEANPYEDYLNTYGLDENDLTEDVDSDGLATYVEYFYDIDPTSADSDLDTLPDGWEVQYGLDPDDGSDAELDLDGDGLSNTTEYALGYDPSNPADPGSYRDTEDLQGFCGRSTHASCVSDGDCSFGGCGGGGQICYRTL